MLSAIKNKKSEKLSTELYRFYKAYVAKFDNYDEAGADLGVTGKTISRILELKRCTTSTRILIQEKQQASKSAA